MVLRQLHVFLPLLEPAKNYQYLLCELTFQPVGMDAVAKRMSLLEPSEALAFFHSFLKSSTRIVSDSSMDL